MHLPRAVMYQRNGKGKTAMRKKLKLLGCATPILKIV